MSFGSRFSNNKVGKSTGGGGEGGFSGDYNDLINKPTMPVVPTKTSELINNSDFETTSGAQKKVESHSNNFVKHVTAEERTKWNSKSDFSGSYKDLTNKPEIPTVDVDKSYVDTELAKKATKTEMQLAYDKAMEASSKADEKATKAEVKSAHDKATEAFQFANDGKTAISKAVTAKGVTALSTDTFSTLATKIGQISTGKKFASGNGTSQTNSSGLIVVTGINFKPSLVVVSSLSDSATRLTVLSSESNLIYTHSGEMVQVVSATSSSKGRDSLFSNFNSNFNITNNGFSTYINSGSAGIDYTYNWIAIG